MNWGGLQTAQQITLNWQVKFLAFGGDIQVRLNERSVYVPMAVIRTTASPPTAEVRGTPSVIQAQIGELPAKGGDQEHGSFKGATKKEQFRFAIPTVMPPP